jgi:hypothetical protein
MSNIYNDMHLEQAFEDALSHHYEITNHINKLRDLVAKDDLSQDDYITIAEAITRHLDGRAGSIAFG